MKVVAVQAQQRYRERRKQKFSEMEESLNALASQVDQMNSVQSQNSLLQACRRPSHTHVMIRARHRPALHLFVSKACPEARVPTQNAGASA